MSPKQFCVIDDEVYNVDLSKGGLKYVKRAGDAFFEYKNNVKKRQK